jgi:membrane associated rhomboid family serine protease
MIPLRDSEPSGSFPVVTIVLILLNGLVWLYELSIGQGIDRFILEYGLTPLRVVTFYQYEGGFVGNALLPTITSLFLHGGWLHVIGNMWFLWIFGDNVEDRLGHVKFLFFYLLCGMASGIVQTFFHPLSRIPTIGASGAVSGVLGAYLIAFPTASVSTLVLIFIVRIPAFIFLIFWFIFQFLSGTAELGSAYQDTGGVAYWAHISGFIFGIVLMWLFPKNPKRSVHSWADDRQGLAGPFPRR